MNKPSLPTTFALTVVTLIAFAGNSILCRLALVDPAIDPISFTALRIVSGACVLLPFLLRRSDVSKPPKTNWRPGLALFTYAITFSLAYVTLDAGIGALLLFGAVQVTMLAAGLLRGERWSKTQGFGLLVAMAGFVLLVSPGLSAADPPDPIGATLMAVSGVAWGVYSLYGRGVSAPTRATARNFLLATPLVLVTAGVMWNDASFTTNGVVLALCSGVLTSGFGYVVWYAALRGHSVTSAAIVQLAVPVIAALGGILLLSEELSIRFVVASVLTLGGVAASIVGARRS